MCLTKTSPLNVFLEGVESTMSFLPPSHLPDGPACPTGPRFFFFCLEGVESFKNNFLYKEHSESNTHSFLFIEQ